MQIVLTFNSIKEMEEFSKGVRVGSTKLKKGYVIPFEPDDPVGVLSVSERALNCLRGEHIETVRQLCGQTRGNLLRIPNMGRKSLMEIEEALAKHGLSFAKAGQP